jgi:hypothetical protein
MQLSSCVLELGNGATVQLCWYCCTVDVYACALIAAFDLTDIGKTYIVTHAALHCG